MTRKPGNGRPRAAQRPLWPGSGPSEQAVRRRLRASLGREPSGNEVRAGTEAASTMTARRILARMARMEGTP